jgi:glycosyltransferase involved in cell wall biosynthesis
LQLVVDARMLGYSGIGTYIANVLPGVLRHCSALDPIVVMARQSAGTVCEAPTIDSRIVTWDARPLSWRELTVPPIPRGEVLWWAPHFNVPLRLRVPLVVTLHDLLPVVQPRTRRIARVALAFWLARIRRHALHVICVSEFTRRHVTELAGVEKSRTSVIPLGVRSSPCAHAGSAVPYLLFVGMLKPHKNLAGLLRAFARIADRIPHRLVVVGKQRGLRGVDRAAIRIASTLGSRVEFLEDVADSELAVLICGADLLIQPSFFEGFGLPPLEAMAAGTPVLVARAGALPEVCGDAAWYCDPDSVADIAFRILELLNDPSLRARLGASGRARAAQFTWERCAAGTSRVLLAAAEACRPRPR